MGIYGYVWVYMGTYVYIWVTILSVPQICLNSKTIFKPHRPMVWWLLRLTFLSVLCGSVCPSHSLNLRLERFRRQHCLE